MSSKPRILIVDDEKFLCLSLARLLKKNGFDVDIAHNGNDAITLVEQATTAYALALIDLNMPQVSGEAAAHQLRALAPELKIIMMTGYSPNLLPETCPTIQNLSVGDLLLFKPFEHGAVMGAIRQLLP